MKSSKHPSDGDLVLVDLILQFFNELRDELLYLLHKALDWHSLQSNTLWGVNDEVHTDGAVRLFCMETIFQNLSQQFMQCCTPFIIPRKAGPRRLEQIELWREQTSAQGMRFSFLQGCCNSNQELFLTRLEEMRMLRTKCQVWTKKSRDMTFALLDYRWMPCPLSCCCSLRFKNIFKRIIVRYISEIWEKAQAPSTATGICVQVRRLQCQGLQICFFLNQPWKHFFFFFL